ncbi:MAG: hypothetical protein IM638_07435 [Bacteroidetes bacterium]|nr:hypothetical protein [Bacteroidota bacterium]
MKLNNTLNKLIAPFVTIFVCYLLGCTNSSVSHHHRSRTVDSLCQNDSLYRKYYRNYQTGFEIDDAILRGKNSHKKTVICFNSLACVNCRDFENKILFSDSIKSLIQTNFIFENLFVDERIRLSDSKRAALSANKRNFVWTGEYYSGFQIELTHSGHNPVFALLDGNGKVISTYTGDLSRDKFHSWLLENQ